MPCYYPMQGYRSRTLTESGKRPITFDPEKGYIDMPMEVPCGQCVGCRLEKSRQWAVRCVHESQMHQQNCFITLTYNNKFLPKDGSLNVKHYQDFMKRLRFKYVTKNPFHKEDQPEAYEQFNKKHGIRFFHCGEYGSKNLRPHYHAIIFNHDFEDKKLWQDKHGVKLYVSKQLEELWPYGFSTIGDVTFESAAYVARYIMKKVNGQDAEDHYTVVNKKTGEISKLKPEYITMSRNPGVATEWYKCFKGDVYPSDFIVMNGKKMRPPKFYDEIYQRQEPELHLENKKRRRRDSEKHKDNNSYERLVVREKCTKAKLTQLKRKYENET